MVMKDAELDELWRELGHYRGKIKEHLEVATDTESTMSSTVTERLFREYRDLKANYEHDHEVLGKLQRDYTLRVKALDERTKELIEARKKSDELTDAYLPKWERDLSLILQEIVNKNLRTPDDVGKRVIEVRNSIRSSLVKYTGRAP